MVAADSSSVASSLPTRVPTVTLAEYLECDYEINCSPLYKAIENAIVNENEDEDYDDIAHFLEQGKWPSKNPLSDTNETAGSAQLQAKTWVSRFKTNTVVDGKKAESRKIEWSQLPLHLAVVGGAPSNIIGGLVKLYPMSLRCTDDQKMLPLHLAMRHGAEDEIVAYLLMQFPEAVNAKGKHGRTPVDCALRARDKVRGIILETFVEKTKSSLIAGFQREKAVLQGSLDVARQQWDETSSRLQVKEAVLTTMEEQHRELVKEFESSKAFTSTKAAAAEAALEDLKKEKDEMEEALKQKIEKMENQKLTESIEFQQAIETLQGEKLGLEGQVRRLVEEEGNLRTELSTVKKQLSAAATPEDFKKIKMQAELMESYRISRTMSQTHDGIKELLTVVKQNKSNDPELQSIKASLQKLEKSKAAVQSTEEVDALKAEVDRLRAELKSRNESSRNKLEVAILKKSLEAELRNSGDKNCNQIAALQKAIEAANPSSLESKMAVELAAMKTEMESLRMELKENALASKTKQDLVELDLALDAAISHALDPRVKKEFQAMKKTADQLVPTLFAHKSTDDILDVSKQVHRMKESMHQKEAISKIRAQADALLQSLNTTIKEADGMTQQLEMVELKRHLSSCAGEFVDLDKKDAEELIQIRSELNNVRKILKDIKEATKTHNELKVLKANIKRELVICKEKMNKEVKGVSAAIDAVELDPMQSKILKDTLSAAIRNSHKKVYDEMRQIKESAAGIKPANISSKDKFLWDSMREDIEKLKIELKHRSDGKLDEELLVVKAALEQIHADHERKKSEKIIDLRNDLQSLAIHVDAPPDDQSLQTPPNSSPVVAKAPKARVVSVASPISNKKGGIRKFFSRPFTRMGPIKRSSKVVNAEEEKVLTILPPSGIRSENLTQTPKNYGGVSSGEEDMPPAVKTAMSKEKVAAAAKADNKEKEVTLELHRSISKQLSASLDDDMSESESSDEGKYRSSGKTYVSADEIKSMPCFASPKRSSRFKSTVDKPSALRKVQSMDLRERMPTRSVLIDPYAIVRTWSKSVIRAAQTEDRDEQ